MNSLRAINSLDKIRVRDGTSDLEVFFHGLANEDREEALNLVNAENLHFTSLFVLKDELKSSDLLNDLTLRNKLALEITDEVSKDEKKGSVMKYISSDYTQIVYSTLKWIFETGSKDDGLSDDFDEVLDSAAILLTKMYRDETILPIMVDMIFDRNRRNFFTHDLVWAFFESKDPSSLIMIANRLLSNEAEDTELASTLLSFVPGIDKNSNNVSKEKKYAYFLNWMDENNSFLYFTGQSLQQVNSPITYVIVLEAKYLCRFVSVDTGKPIKPLTEKEGRILNEFRKLDQNTKIFLSTFSNRMHNRDLNFWNMWIDYPIEKQIEMAKDMAGGMVYND